MFNYIFERWLNTPNFSAATHFDCLVGKLHFVFLLYLTFISSSSSLLADTYIVLKFSC